MGRTLVGEQRKATKIFQDKHFYIASQTKSGILRRQTITIPNSLAEPALGQTEARLGFLHHFFCKLAEEWCGQRPLAARALHVNDPNLGHLIKASGCLHTGLKVWPGRNGHNSRVTASDHVLTPLLEVEAWWLEKRVWKRNIVYEHFISIMFRLQSNPMSWFP